MLIFDRLDRSLDIGQDLEPRKVSQKEYLEDQKQLLKLFETVTKNNV